MRAWWTTIGDPKKQKQFDQWSNILVNCIRVTQGYPGRGPRHPGVPSGAAWCAVLGPVPPGARCSVLPLLGPGQRAASSRGAFGRRLVRGARSGPSWRVEVEEGTRTGGRLSHPQPWAFLVLAPGLRQGWPSWCGVQRPVRGPPSCGTTRAHVLRRCMPIDRGVMAPFGVYDHAPGGSTPTPTVNSSIDGQVARRSAPPPPPLR